MDWNKFLKRTGLNEAGLIREMIDLRIKAAKPGLPPSAARWCNKMQGPALSPTNAMVAKMFRKGISPGRRTARGTARSEGKNGTSSR
jgi:hypothetical protein